MRRGKGGKLEGGEDDNRNSWRRWMVISGRSSGSESGEEKESVWKTLKGHLIILETLGREE